GNRRRRREAMVDCQPPSKHSVHSSQDDNHPEQEGNEPAAFRIRGWGHTGAFCHKKLLLTCSGPPRLDGTRNFSSGKHSFLLKVVKEISSANPSRTTAGVAGVRS